MGTAMYKPGDMLYVVLRNTKGRVSWQGELPVYKVKGQHMWFRHTSHASYKADMHTLNILNTPGKVYHSKEEWERELN